MPNAALTLVLPLLVFSSPAEEGDRLLRLSGNTFSLEVMEPEGWELATRAAPQIANFIFHPEEADWRRADTLIFVRFVSREESEKREAFIESSRERFQGECAFVDGDVGTHSLREVSTFLVEEFLCPGTREEILAVTEVPKFFVVFSLSAQAGISVDPSKSVFEKILKSFIWHEAVTNKSNSEN